MPTARATPSSRIESAHTCVKRVRICSTRAALQVLPPTFTTQMAKAQGAHSRDISAWRAEGQVVELSRGVFRLADAPLASYPDALAVSYRSPRAVVCCVSAAAIHELTDEMPQAVNVAVPKQSHPPMIDQPPVLVFRFSEATFELGLSSFEAAPGEHVRIYDAARTVVDLVRLRHRWGGPVAHAALRRYLSAPGSRPAKLLEYAGRLSVFGPMKTALDVATAR